MDDARKIEYDRLIAYGYTPLEIHTYWNMEDSVKETEVLARRIEDAAKLKYPSKELFSIAEEVRNMETEITEPSEYDWDILNLVEQMIEIINSLRGRVAILEGVIFDGERIN